MRKLSENVPHSDSRVAVLLPFSNLGRSSRVALSLKAIARGGIEGVDVIGQEGKFDGLTGAHALTMVEHRRPNGPIGRGQESNAVNPVEQLLRVHTGNLEVKYT